MSKQPVQHAVTRVLGRPPVIRSVRLTTNDSTNLLTEAFGPPELKSLKRSTLVFWNFERQDGTRGFTLFARVKPKSNPRNIQVRLVATAGVRSFVDWTIDKLSGVESGEETPIFVNEKRRSPDHSADGRDA